MLLLRRKRFRLIPTLLKLGVAFGVFYFAFNLISQQSQVNFKKKTLEKIVEKLEEQNAKNKEIKNFLEKTENSIEYIVRLARENCDLVEKGEQVFVNVD